MPSKTLMPFVNRIQLSAETVGHTQAVDITPESTRLTSELLTRNHVEYHTRWNAGFHNHIAHHLLALWALGATPEEIQAMWDYNAPYQAPIHKSLDSPPRNLDLGDPAVFDSCLGKDEHYSTFLHFFSREISLKGSPAVIREYLLSGSPRADDIYSRMYTDLVHPMIHLGCGIEFQQPSIVAESLAGACIHENWPKHFLLPAEALSSSQPPPPVPGKSLLQILEGMKLDPVISSAVKSTDPFNKIADGLIPRVDSATFARHLSQIRVGADPESLRGALSEMMHTSAYIMGAAQRPGKEARMDFVLLHAVTLSGFYPAILAQGWLTDGEKARLLEGKMRSDAVLYAGCGCPDLHPERISGYVPEKRGNGEEEEEEGWEGLFRRARVYRDEGHAAKLVRSLHALEELPEEEEGKYPIGKGDFVKIANMALDSIERAVEPEGTTMPDGVAEMLAQRVGHGGEFVVDNQKRWVFYGGVQGAWKYVPDLIA